MLQRLLWKINDMYFEVLNFKAKKIKYFGIMLITQFIRILHFLATTRNRILFRIIYFEWFLCATATKASNFMGWMCKLLLPSRSTKFLLCIYAFVAGSVVISQRVCLNRFLEFY